MKQQILADTIGSRRTEIANLTRECAEAAALSASLGTACEAAKTAKAATAKRLAAAQASEAAAAAVAGHRLRRHKVLFKARIKIGKLGNRASDQEVGIDGLLDVRDAMIDLLAVAEIASVPGATSLRSDLSRTAGAVETRVETLLQTRDRFRGALEATAGRDDNVDTAGEVARANQIAATQALLIDLDSKVRTALLAGLT